jgi:hypothetical protein
MDHRIRFRNTCNTCKNNIYHYYIMPLFVVGQRVKRREDREVTGAVALEVIEKNDTFAYCIQYDEEPQNVGWWLEADLSAA